MSTTTTDVLRTRPKMRYVCGELEKMAGDLGPNAQLPTVLQLRDNLGVSMSTLHDSLREMERRQVLRSVPGVGIFVAQPQKRVATNTIGFLTSAPQSSVQGLVYYGMILDGLRNAASQRRQDLLIVDNTVPYENWDKLDGVIVGEMVDPSSPFFPGLQKLPSGLPVVSILHRLPGLANITADDFQGTYLLTEHLLAQGHRRIAYLARYKTDAAILRNRLDGYKTALKDAGIQVDERWMRELRPRVEWSGGLDWYFRGGDYCVKQWLAEDWRDLGCTALIVQNDEAAFGAFAAFKQAGIAVPGDVTITGFDGIANPNSLLLSLTTIRVPLFEIGQGAVSLLAEQMAHPDEVVGDRCLPVQLIEGQSSAPPAPIAAR